MLASSLLGSTTLNASRKESGSFYSKKSIGLNAGAWPYLQVEPAVRCSFTAPPRGFKIEADEVATWAASLVASPTTMEGAPAPQPGARLPPTVSLSYGALWARKSLPFVVLAHNKVGQGAGWDRITSAVANYSAETDVAHKESLLIEVAQAVMDRNEAPPPLPGERKRKRGGGRPKAPKRRRGAGSDSK